MSYIPQRKHSNQELSELRVRSAMISSSSPIAEMYQKKIANKGLVILGYLLPLTAPSWATVKMLTKEVNYSMNDFYIMLIPIILALIVALWIALKCELSRHNAAFIFIISLVCCFPILNAVNTDKTLRYELVSLFGVEKSVPQAEQSNDVNPDNSELSPEAIREILRLEKERVGRESVETEIREKLLDSDTPPLNLEE